jgi:asparagine synthase (glutamine-hydrolysing)
MGLPLNAKISDGYSKAIMRRALDMPEVVRKRRDKIGFYTPENSWMTAHSAEYRAVFTAPDFRARRYIDPEKIAADWDSLTRGKDDIGLFRYICLEKWMRIFDVKTA